MAVAMENHETSTLYLRNRLCSAVHFLLECFGPIHHMRMTKCISFVLKDIGTYLHQMDLTSQEEEYFQVPLTTMDEHGVLKKMDPTASDTNKNNELGTNNEFEFVSRDTSTDSTSHSKYGELRTYEKLLALERETCSRPDIVEDNEIRMNNVLRTLQKEANNVTPLKETSHKEHLINEYESGISKAELLRIFFVYYLSTNGNTHYKVIFKDLDNMAPRDVSKYLSSASIPGKLSYFRKHREYFRMDSSGNVELQAAFYSPFEDLPVDSGASEVNSNGEDEEDQGFDGKRKYNSTEASIDDVIKKSKRPKSQNFLSDSVNREVRSSEVDDFSKTDNGTKNFETICSSLINERSIKMEETGGAYELPQCTDNIRDTSNLNARSSSACFDKSASVSISENSCTSHETSPEHSTSVPNKEFISNRINSCVQFLQTFFKLQRVKPLLCIILRVLEDVDRFFSGSSCVVKVDIIQSLVESVNGVKNSAIDPPNCSPFSKVVPLLNEQERKTLYFVYFLSLQKKSKWIYNNLFDTFYTPKGCPPIAAANVGITDSEKLSFFKNASKLFRVNHQNGIVHYKTNLEVSLHASFRLYAFRYYGTPLVMTSNDKITTQNLILQLEASLVHKRLFSFVHFLLHAFGKQPCDRLMKCISFVFTDIKIFWNELSTEEQQQLLSTIPGTVLNSDNYLESTVATYELDTTYESPWTLFKLHVVANMAWRGKTDTTELFRDFYASQRNTILDHILHFHANHYIADLNKPCEFWERAGRRNLRLSASFHSFVKTDKNVSQFGVSEELLSSLDVPHDIPVNILDLLTERMQDAIFHLLSFFRLNLRAGFLEVVLHALKKGWVFFRFPQSYQEAVIKKCFESFCVDQEGGVSLSRIFIRTQKKNRRLTSMTRQLLLCLTYIIHREGSMHYRRAFSSYRNLTKTVEKFDDLKQFMYFKNRQNYFIVDNNGFVSVSKIKSIMFDCASLIHGNSDNENRIESNTFQDRKSDVIRKCETFLEPSYSYAPEQPHRRWHQ